MFDRFVDRFDHVIERIALVSAMAAAAAALAILGLVTLEVVLRELFAHSTLIADEMSGYLNVAIVYLGLAYTLREGGFIRVETLYNHIADKAGRIVPWFIVAVSLAYVLVLIGYMVREVLYSYHSGLRSMFVSQTPLFWPQMLIPIGLTVLALQFVAFGLKRVRNLP